MHSLGSLQQAFQDYVYEPENKLDGIVEDVRSDERVSAKDRLGIYSNAYRLRLLEALLTDYPGLHGLAGDEEFDILGRAFIAVHASPYYNLRWYGGELPNFLRSSEEYRQYPVLADMADFELAIATAFDAANDPVLLVGDIAQVAPEAWGEMRFRPHASVQRVDLEWDVIPLWKAVSEEREGDHPAKNESPVHWVVWRADLRTQFRSMPDDESAAFDALRKGSSFGEICEVLLEWHDAQVVAMRAAELLKQWTQSGMLSKLT